jgi:hypothetical protein
MVQRATSGYIRWMDKNSLVENEGVNAGSAEQIEEPDTDVSTGGASTDDVRSGGAPESVEPKAPVDDLDPGGESGSGTAERIGGSGCRQH